MQWTSWGQTGPVEKISQKMVGVKSWFFVDSLFGSDLISFYHADNSTVIGLYWECGRLGGSNHLKMVPIDTHKNPCGILSPGWLPILFVGWSVIYKHRKDCCRTLHRLALLGPSVIKQHKFQLTNSGYIPTFTASSLRKMQGCQFAYGISRKSLKLYSKTPIIRVLEIFELFTSSKKTRKLQARKKWDVSYVYQSVWRENYKHANCLVGWFRENFTPRIIGVLQYIAMSVVL